MALDGLALLFAPSGKAGALVDLDRHQRPISGEGCTRASAAPGFRLAFSQRGRWGRWASRFVDHRPAVPGSYG
jgi:hypothetical protein